MKTLNEYLALPYRMELVKDPDEGGFVVSFPDLPGCITCGETLEAAVANAADAKRAWLQAACRSGSRTISRTTPVSSSCGFPKACIALWRSMRGRRASA